MRVFGMITTLSSKRYTEYALNTFIDTTPLRPQDRFLLIDNDGAWETLPDALVPFGDKITNSKEKSFAANMNEVMAFAFSKRADLFLLNNDLIFTKDWLSPLLAPEISILSPISNREVQHQYKNFHWVNSL